MLRQTLPLLLVLVLVPVAAHAQSPAPVAIVPVVITSGAQIQVPVPPNADKPRLQILLAGSNTVLDDERANIQNGVATARLEADPGTYDVRVVTSDKTRTPLGAPRRFQIPGFKREAGRWLFNGSAVAYEGTNPPTLISALPNLKRATKTKFPASVATPTAVRWDTPTFGAEFAEDGIVLNAGGVPPADVAYTKSELQKQQATLAAVHPNGALLLSEPLMWGNFQPYQEAYIDALAPLVDGIIIGYSQLKASPPLSSEPNSLVKIARRNVEESPGYDLPVFARFVGSPSDAQMLRAFQDGASNIIVPDGTTSPFLDVLTRQSARFAGSVTIEDVGLRVNDFDRFAPILRRAGRVPLLARLPGEGNSADKDNNKNAEALIISFDASTDAATLDKIDQAARRGITLYCEGALPPALFAKWGEITKTQIAALPAPKTSTVTLSDPWFWGTINDQNFDVTQTLSVTVKPSMSSQTNNVKGEAIETVARPLARFNDDPNAVMLCPAGKGRILWAPFNINGNPTPVNSRGRVPVPATLRADDLEPINPLVSHLSIDSYYAAIAGAMQAALVTYSATQGDAAAVSVALRALPADANNPKSSAVSLIAFFNSSNAPVDLNAQVRGDGTYALDLMTNQPVPLKIRDFSGRVSLQIPANGFRWIAIAKDAQAWDSAGKNGVKAQLK